MECKRVCVLYFSPTGNTKKVAEQMADAVADAMGFHLLRMQLHECRGEEDVVRTESDYRPTKAFYDVTKPSAREQEYIFEKSDFVIIGAPTYAGKLPNKILPFYQEKLKGNGAKCIAVVTYGNRDFENSLAELVAILTDNGFEVIGGAAVVGEHPFSAKLGTDRPNEADLQEIRRWAFRSSKNHTIEDGTIPGDADAPYYVPKQVNGEPAVFLKAKPQTDADKCTGCGKCSSVCPMGSIDRNNPAEVTGICIKCQACVKNCPTGAKYFDDEQFLSHIEMLESNYTEAKENLFFMQE